jgi:hypothetical protein
MNAINKWANGQFSKEVQMANKYMKQCSPCLAIKETNQNNTEIPPFPSQNGNHPKNEQQMLVRIGQGKETLYTVVEM